MAVAFLIAAFIAVTAFVVWADHTGWDPFASLYGSDHSAPDDVSDWRRENWR